MATTKAATQPVETKLETLIEERKKDAIENVAPRLIELVKVAGVRTEIGFNLRKDIATFDYNELTGIVSVNQGPNPCLYVNVDNKRCSLYKEGTWKLIFNQLCAEYLNSSTVASDMARKHEVKFKENFGVR